MTKRIFEVIMSFIQVAIVIGAIQFGWWLSEESMTYVNDYDLRIKHISLEEHGYKYCPYCGESLSEEK